MIRINLLPYRPAQRLRALKRILFTWLGTVVAGCVLLFGVDQLILGEIQQQTATKASNSNMIAALDEQLGEVKEINDRKALAEARLKLIHQLSQEQSITIRVLAELTTTIPDQVWLTKIETKRNQMTLTGSATSSAVVADFMRKLAKSPYLSDIELSSIELSRSPASKTIQGKAHNFSLHLKFSTPKPSTATASIPQGGAQTVSALGK
ncbi:MAG: PilN domain-containing protein [Magnetococcales bacterium]|nr:PilN domain-containing protein [Magnetococcales bacterium]